MYFDVVMEILKRYYVTLCHSLPTDYSKFVSVLHAYGLCNVPLFDKLKACSCPQKRRQLMLDSLIRLLDCEERLLDFCDIIDAIVQDVEFKHNVESFRNGTFTYCICIYTFVCLFLIHTEILAVLSSKPQGSTEWRYPRHKQKVMLMRGIVIGGVNGYVCFMINRFLYIVQSGGHTNQLSEDFTGSLTAIDTVPGTKILYRYL